MLTNHSLPGVNAGYITRHRLLEDHLRGQQERISSVVMAAAVRGKGDAVAKVTSWLNAWRPEPTAPDAPTDASPLTLAA